MSNRAMLTSQTIFFVSTNIKTGTKIILNYKETEDNPKHEVQTVVVKIT